MQYLRRAFALAALVLAIPAGALAQGMTVFNNSCSTNGTGCHAMPPEGARLNAANASAVIVQSNTTHGMGFSAGFMTANAGNIATYIGTLISGSQTLNVNYHATAGFTVNDIVLNDGGAGVITTINQVSAPARGNMLGSGTASVSYQHTANNCTSDSFQVRGQGLANTSNRTINVTVNAPSAPVASNTSTTVAHSTGAQAVNLSLLGALSGTAPLGTMNLGVLSPSVGVLTATGATTFTYAASSTTYAPTLSFNYSVDGPCGTTSATRSFTLNVNSPPAPVVSNVGPLTIASGATTPIDLTPFISGVVASIPAGTFNLVASQPTAGGSGSTSVAGNIVTYSPGAFFGTTTFTYTKAGPGGTSNTGTVTINVNPPAPIAGAGTATIVFNTPTAINLAPFITGGAAASVTPSAPVNGTVIASGPTSVTFTPTAGFSGTASFSYTATNAGGTSGVGTVTVTVNPAPPIAGAGTATVAFNAPTVINLAPFLSGGAATSVTPSSPVNGTAVASGPTSVTFTPTAGFTGAASFAYTATNAGGTSIPATVTITVTAQPPVAGAGTATVAFNTPTVINLAPFITGGPATSVTPSAPVNGTVVASGPSSVTFTPTAGYSGPASFTYTATNTGGTSAPATVTITVSGQLPIAGAGTATVPFNAPTLINLASFITGGAATSVTPSGAVNGSVVASGGTSVTFTPATGYSGAASFTYTATNADGTSGSATISVTVLGAVSFSGPSATGTGTITASFFGGGAGCVFSSPRFIAGPPGAPPVPPEAPAGNVAFPHGLFDFSATGCAQGSTLTFTIVYPAAITNASYWKYGPTPGNATPHWYLLPATISGNTATFTITDGGLGDDDLTANGTIVDQGGPGIGGPVQTPTLSAWMLALLGLLLAGFGGRRLRAR